MDPEDDFGCLGIPTPEEMLRQHVILIENEFEELSREYQAARRNIAKLITMHAEVAIERDRLKAELERTKILLSTCYLENSRLGTELYGLRMEQQHYHLMVHDQQESSQRIAAALITSNPY
ncbi:MAG: hypothetical protein ACOH2R_08650 [Pseudomonas sp.]